MKRETESKIVMIRDGVAIAVAASNARDMQRTGWERLGAVPVAAKDQDEAEAGGDDKEALVHVPQRPASPIPKLEDLRRQCRERGIEIDLRWGQARLSAAIAGHAESASGSSITLLSDDMAQSENEPEAV